MNESEMLHDLLSLSEKEGKPSIRVLQKTDRSKLMAIALAKGISLSRHKAPDDARILVVKGKILFVNDSESLELSKLEVHSFPKEEVHSVEALEDSIFLLILGNL